MNTLTGRSLPERVGDLTPSQAGRVLAEIAGALADQQGLVGTARVAAMPRLLAQVMAHPSAAGFVKVYTGAAGTVRHYAVGPPMAPPAPPRELADFLTAQLVGDLPAVISAMDPAMLGTLTMWLEDMKRHRGGGG